MNQRRTILLLLCFASFYSCFSQDYTPVTFTENKGQWDKRVRYKADVPNGALFIHNHGLTVLQHRTDDWSDVQSIIHGHKDDGSFVPRDEAIRVHSHAYSVEFLKANTNATVTADKPVEGHINYFLGNDPSQWAAACQSFQGITIKNLYPHIDLRYYSDNGQVKYDFIVHPGGNVADIALQYKGQDGLEIKDRQLLICTSVGTLKELEPYSYQYQENEKRKIAARYLIQGNIVTFDVPHYDPNTTLVIDPTLVFVSFSGSRVMTWGYTATYGPDGSLFAGGIVFSDGFPANTGAFQQVWGGGDGANGFDMGIVKLSSRGDKRLFATYIGGSGNEQPHSLIADAEGNLIIAGRTNSTGGPESKNYPTTLTNGKGVIGSGGGYDIVVTKLSADGSRLLGSKRIGGNEDDGKNISTGHTRRQSLEQNYGDDARSEVQLDGAGNIYIASCTQSKNFPTLNGFQTTLRGNQDGVVLKLSSDVSTLLYSTYIGGSGNDAAYVISLNPFDGRAFVAGGTESNDFPGIKAGPMGATFNGAIDGFIAAINTNGGPASSIYLGTPAIDQVYGIQFDKYGYPYAMGQTTGTWPVKKPDINQPSFYADQNGKQFIVKLEKDLSAFVYSTVFGSGRNIPDISPTAFLIDRCENVYVSGWGGQISEFLKTSTTGLKVKNSVVKNTTDGSDFYFFVLKRDATEQLYGDFFGQDGGLADHVDGGTSRFDANGVIYQAICANCAGNARNRPTFPTTPGAAEPVNRSLNCDLAMIKVAFNLAGVHIGLQASINGVVKDTAGCVPLTVTFKDTIQNAISKDATYQWTFGDNSPVITTKETTAQHTYNRVGTFKVRVIVTDPESCNIYDTAYVHIRVGNNEAKPAFTAERIVPCTSNKFRFTNTSIAPNGPAFGGQSFVWDFGDGSPRVTAGAGAVEHAYSAAGTYKVRLHMVDTAYCNAPDSAEQTVRIGPALKAQFVAPPAGCAPAEAVFTNTSTSGQQFIWDFGDGTAPLQTTAEKVAHIYTKPGSYKVKLIAMEPAPCFQKDSATLLFQVFDQPIADFTANPQPPELNASITFTNLSLKANRYKWWFGDGDSLVTASTKPVSHDYNVTGTYNACLVAYTNNGCTDTLCKPVQALVAASVDVPNAFTPLSGDMNSVVSVRGFGIGKLKFAIYNRWGQLVFQSTNKQEGWNGWYKGVLQPMDVYAYILEVEFVDGRKATKTGDITLIR